MSRKMEMDGRWEAGSGRQEGGGSGSGSGQEEEGG